MKTRLILRRLRAHMTGASDAVNLQNLRQMPKYGHSTGRRGGARVSEKLDCRISIIKEKGISRNETL
ncbi:hypothetical protein, partial [Klebsiella pneumoniae]|uniref:hypothetical protein n=1 Tax=Klebsiella pneumoniae TaxID=573 RepID=UPI001C703655